MMRSRKSLFNLDYFFPSTIVAKRTVHMYVKQKCYCI